MANDKIQNSIATDQLFKEYNWYLNSVPELVQKASDEFFQEKFKINLIGISQNINCLIDKEACFVTKIRINQEYDMFVRLSDRALDLILTQALGQSKNKFNINKISDLEAKIITTFNDFMFETLKSIILEPDSTELKRTNWDVVHLTFLITDAGCYSNKFGKLIVTLPKALLNPEIITSSSEKFSEVSFPSSHTYGKFIVGSTKFPLYDIKNLEADDVVVFENSSVSKLSLSINGEILPVNLNPNMDLLIPDYNDGGNEMGNTHQNIWDSIEVEMSAEFDAVKITLGELKDIEEGLVVDITSLYDNNVVLKVENKPIASGTLVIVNDRYGVKINNVIAEGATPSSRNYAPAEEQQVSDNAEEQEYEENYEESNEAQEETSDNEDEEFDYSDFELEDENI